MSTDELYLYSAMLVFFLMIIGLVLTAIEYKNMENESAGRNGSSGLGREKK